MSHHFITFYAIGIILYLIPYTRELFITLIPFNLLFVITFILMNHTMWNTKIACWFSFIAVSSFFLEMAGTNTGEIFGRYQYLRGLGIQVNHTPLIIGCNWLFLVYSSHDLVRRFIKNAVICIIAGAAMMIFYDVVMEWVAPSMKMWQFDNGYPPIRNFITWFIAALIFHTGFILLNIRTDNRVASTLFVIQIPFFLLIGLYNELFIN